MSERVNEVAKSGVMSYILPRAAGQILKRKLSSTPCTWANIPGERLKTIQATKTSAVKKKGFDDGTLTTCQHSSN